MFHMGQWLSWMLNKLATYIVSRFIYSCFCTVFPFHIHLSQVRSYQLCTNLRTLQIWSHVYDHISQEYVLSIIKKLLTCVKYCFLLGPSCGMILKYLNNRDRTFDQMLKYWGVCIYLSLVLRVLHKRLLKKAVFTFK